MSDIERKALIAEIERFKEEAMEIKVVQVLADSYENDGLFDHSISDDNKVSWVKVQAWQLWGFWKANAVPEGFVLVPNELSDDVADKLAEKQFKVNETLFNDLHRDLSESSLSNSKKRWVDQKARCFKVDYQTLVIEAREMK